jgi:hypothetical protein
MGYMNGKKNCLQNANLMLPCCLTSNEAFYFPHLKLDFSLGLSDVLPDKLIELLLRKQLALVSLEMHSRNALDPVMGIGG